MDFTGLLPAVKERIRPARDVTPILRDSLHLTTWISVGAVVQSAAFLIVGRLALIPAVSFLVYRMLEAYAITTGLKHNPYMENVIMEKVSAQFPNSEGRYGSKASNSDVAVLLISTQSNHPMGMLAPGFKQIGDYFQGMVKELENDPIKNGFLGATNYLGAERSTNNQIMSVMYFKSADHVHEYAQGPLHREAWNWWNKIVAKHPHLMIMHELYQVPKGYWESIYVQNVPSNVAATQHQVTRKASDGVAEEKVWMSPIVHAKGVLKSSAGRMGRNFDETV